MSEYTAIPLNIHVDNLPFLEKESGELEESIDSLIDLIVFTPKGTFCADPEFGFEYWNHEFSNINVREFNNSYVGLMSTAKTLNDITRKQCEESLKESILTYEPRLLDPEVKIELDINSKISRRNSLSKYEIRIQVSGSIDDGLGVAKPYEKRISFMVEPVVKKINI